MPLYVEVWDARSAWLALSIDERIAYLDRMNESLHAFTQTGARLVGVALTDPTLAAPYGTTYVAAWSLPEGGVQVRMLDAILEAGGWHEYFDRNPDKTPTIESRALFRGVQEMERTASLR
jgi:hypothetical protein